ncbi:NUDIX hydrolase domain-like protein [Spinellus fusiger]|nr:NUDIX hydrolase domain-like protein [Spinellus fusiger]
MTGFPELKRMHEQLQTRVPKLLFPPSLPRRASVAVILRWKANTPHLHEEKVYLEEFFSKHENASSMDGRVEVLYMLRATRATDKWSGHVGFPGGKEEKNETDYETAVREVKEEVGLDLTTSDFASLGKLDCREIKTYENKLLMVLTPFVFLQLAQETPALTLQSSEVTAVEWVPLSFFLSATPSQYEFVAEKVAPRVIGKKVKNPIAQSVLGNVTFPSIVLPSDTHFFRLWGITLRITQEVLDLTQPCPKGRPSWRDIHPSKEALPFMILCRTPPTFNSKDLAFFFWLFHRISLYKTPLPDNALACKFAYDSTYFGAFQKAVRMSLFVRLIGSVLTLYLAKRLYQRPM